MGKIKSARRYLLARVGEPSTHSALSVLFAIGAFIFGLHTGAGWITLGFAVLNAALGILLSDTKLPKWAVKTLDIVDCLAGDAPAFLRALPMLRGVAASCGAPPVALKLLDHLIALTPTIIQAEQDAAAAKPVVTFTTPVSGFVVPAQSSLLRLAPGSFQTVKR